MSPDGSFISLLGSIETPDGDVWTISDWGNGAGAFIRNGTPAGGSGTGLLLHGGALYGRGLDGSWATWNGWVWTAGPGPDLSATPSPPPPPPPPPSPPPAVENLFGMAQDDHWPTMAADLNRPIASVLRLGFVADKGGWDNYNGSAAYIVNSATGVDRTRRLLVGVGFFPDNFPTGGLSMADAAAGLYNDHYTYVAQQMAIFPKTIVRVAWEFNAAWYPWGASAPGVDAANYAANYRAAFIHMVERFRAVSSDFTFVWNPNLPSQWFPDDPWRDTYPGDAYVDYIGVDAYDQPDSSHPDPADRWGPVGWGLDRIAEFAALHSKPIAIPEWAAGAQGDNPLYVTNVAAWLKANAVLGTMNCYWYGDANSGYVGWMDGNYPLQFAEFKRIFKIT